MPNAQKNLMEPLMFELAPKQSTASDMPHEGEEFGFLLSGSVVIHLGKKKYTCKKGESFYFVANKVHYLENPKDSAAKLLWISSPPTF